MITTVYDADETYTGMLVPIKKLDDNVDRFVNMVLHVPFNEETLSYYQYVIAMRDASENNIMVTSLSISARDPHALVYEIDHSSEKVVRETGNNVTRSTMGGGIVLLRNPLEDVQNMYSVGKCDSFLIHRPFYDLEVRSKGSNSLQWFLFEQYNSVYHASITTQIKFRPGHSIEGEGYY